MLPGPGDRSSEVNASFCHVATELPTPPPVPTPAPRSNERLSWPGGGRFRGRCRTRRRHRRRSRSLSWSACSSTLAAGWASPVAPGSGRALRTRSGERSHRLRLRGRSCATRCPPEDVATASRSPRRASRSRSRPNQDVRRTPPRRRPGHASAPSRATSNRTPGRSVHPRKQIQRPTRMRASTPKR